MEPVADRLARLREQMAARDLDALIIPRADEYLGEYLPAHNERMCWASDFTGSAGVVIVLAERAATELMAPSHYVEAVLGGGRLATAAPGHGDAE